MLDYIDRMTRDAVQLGPEDIARLREVGYDDTAILQMTLIGSWFNYINRVADALGVGRGADRPRSHGDLGPTISSTEIGVFLATCWALTQRLPCVARAVWHPELASSARPCCEHRALEAWRQS